MNTSNGGFLYRLSRLVRPVSLIVGSAVVIAGLVMMTMCARSAVTALVSVGSFLVLLMFTILFVGMVYLITRMSDDIRALRLKKDSSRESTNNEGEPRPPAGSA